jgi:hypothetical protein
MKASADGLLLLENINLAILGYSELGVYFFNVTNWQNI